MECVLELVLDWLLSRKVFQNRSHLAAENYLFFEGLPCEISGLSPTASSWQSSDPGPESSGSSPSDGGGEIAGEV